MSVSIMAPSVSHERLLNGTYSDEPDDDMMHSPSLTPTHSQYPSQSSQPQHDDDDDPIVEQDLSVLSMTSQSHEQPIVPKLKKITPKASAVLYGKEGTDANRLCCHVIGIVNQTSGYVMCDMYV